MLLEKTLDAVDHEGAAAAAEGMSQDEIVAAAIFHVAGLLDRVPTAVNGGQLSLGNLAIEIKLSDNGTISYRDIGHAFELGGIVVADNDGPSTMSGLLTVLQFARDRTDALLYLPATMRQDRIDGLAHSSGAGERFVRSLLANYRRIADEVSN